MNKIRENNSGYSLVEIMLAVALFAFVMGIALDIFQAVNQSQKSAIAAQNIQENLRYTLEVISKEIRQGIKSDGDCKDSFTGVNPPITSTPTNRVYNSGSASPLTDNVLFFKKIDQSSNKEICVAYYIYDNRIKIVRVDKASNSIVADGYITPANINISKFTFTIYDSPKDAVDKFQPRINLQIEAEAASGQWLQPILIQTTISSRMYGD